MMMNTTSATEPGSPGRASEDWRYTDDSIVVVLDGATARTDTGCVHGVAWFTQHLGQALVARGQAGQDLREALADSIRDVAAQHPECDLTNPATPSSFVGMMRISGATLEYLVLGDVAVLLDVAGESLMVFTDDRVSKTAPAERTEADRWPIGSPEKAEALIAMKHGELAAKNRDGGFWTASVDPKAVDQALAGQVELADVRRAAALTDGAARAITFQIVADWGELLDLLEAEGPAAVIARVRAAEHEDPRAVRWARNKMSDDATAVYCQFDEGEPG